MNRSIQANLSLWEKKTDSIFQLTNNKEKSLLVSKDSQYCQRSKDKEFIHALWRERERMNAVNDKREKEINLSVLYLDIIYVLNIQNKKKKIL
jgi:hypothetical protein